MDTIDFIQLAVLLILLLLSGFFSRAETAYTGVNRVKIRALAEEHDPKAETVLKILEHYSDLLSSILIGNNIVNLSASALTTTLTIKLYGSAAVGMCLACTGAVSGEVSLLEPGGTLTITNDASIGSPRLRGSVRLAVSCRDRF